MKKKTTNKHAGSSFDSFLESEGLVEAVNAELVKKQFLYELERQMKRFGFNKNVIRKALRSPATTERVFSLNTEVSLETLARVANAVNAELSVHLVPRSKSKKVA